jgi:hypothetical protein
MPKLRTTVALDERVLRAVRVKAARTGRRGGEVNETRSRAISASSSWNGSRPKLTLESRRL